MVKTVLLDHLAAGGHSLANRLKPSTVNDRLAVTPPAPSESQSTRAPMRAAAGSTAQPRDDPPRPGHMDTASSCTARRTSTAEDSPPLTAEGHSRPRGHGRDLGHPRDRRPATGPDSRALSLIAPGNDSGRCHAAGFGGRRPLRHRRSGPPRRQAAVTPVTGSRAPGKTGTRPWPRTRPRSRGPAPRGIRPSTRPTMTHIGSAGSTTFRSAGSPRMSAGARMSAWMTA